MHTPIHMVTIHPSPFTPQCSPTPPLGIIRYVFRPLAPKLPDAGMEASGGKARRQTLQGYGVQLAIKNMEYTAMDDKVWFEPY